MFKTTLPSDEFTSLKIGPIKNPISIKSRTSGIFVRSKKLSEKKPKKIIRANTMNISNIKTKKIRKLSNKKISLPQKETPSKLKFKNK